VNGRFVRAADSKATPKPRKRTQAEVVAIIRKKVETKLKQEPKGTLGDYIRLVQLQKELEGDEPRDITVTWVEPDVER
jgi:hypothetical protein